MTTTDNYKPTKKSLKGVKQSFSGKDIYFTLDCPLPREEEHGHYVLVYEVISLNKEESFKKVFYASTISEMLAKKSPEHDYSTSFYNSWVVRDLTKRALRQKLIPEWKGLTLVEGHNHFIPLRKPELLKTFVKTKEETKDGTEYVTFLYCSSEEGLYAFESVIKKNNNIQTQDMTSGAVSSYTPRGLLPYLAGVDPVTLLVIPSELDAIAYIKSIT